MLNILVGLNRDIRRSALMDKIKKEVANGRKNMLLLVPEEMTFITQRELLLKLGNGASRHIEAVGFDRLKERIYGKCGHRVKSMDDAGRFLTMAAAAQSVKKDVVYFNASIQRTEFIQHMLKMNDMVLENGMDLSAAVASDKASESLKAKIHDIQLIMAAYEQLSEQSVYDTVQEELRLPSVIREYSNGAFAGTHIYSDGYVEFSKSQVNILAALNEVCDGITMTLPCDGKGDTRNTSAGAVRTIDMLEKTMGEKQVHITGLPNTRTDHEALHLLQAELCADTPSKAYEKKNAEKHIRLYSDPSSYNEILHIAGTILQAVRSEGYRFSDISVVLPNYDHYAPVVERVFSRYHIPAYFASRKHDVGDSPIMKAIGSALDAATRGMPKLETLQFLKSGLSGLKTAEADEIENYALLWNIHGRGWAPNGGWIMHPDGYGREATEDSDAKLEELNALRERGVAPLLKFAATLKDCGTVGEAVMAFNAFLLEIDFQGSLQTFVDELVLEGDRQTAQEYAQVNEILCSAMEQMNGAIGSMETTPTEFSKLLHMMISTYHIATIPATLDQVQVFDIAGSRHICSKIRYIAGCSEGYFPSYNDGAGGLFSEEDAQKLGEILDMSIPCASDTLSLRQMSDINSCISGAKKMLIFSYAYGDGATPSSLYQRVSQLLPAVKVEHGAGENGIYQADILNPDACARLIGRIHQKPEYSAIAYQLMGALAENDEAADLADQIMEKAEWSLGELSPQTVNDLYGNKIPLTATRTDVYSACRYHYFLQYGLGIREARRGGFTSPVFGSFAHAVLEGSIKEIESLGGFDKLSADEIHSITRKHIDAYTESKLRGLEGQPDRYAYLHMRNIREILAIMDTMTREFQRSDFRAEGFEVKVGGANADIPAIPVHGKTASGEYTGIIDRIDGAVVDGKPYFRVIDYKTGKAKTVDVTDILAGQAMQLLEYQAALQKLDGNREMAGFLYVPAKDGIVAMQVKPTDDEAVVNERKKMNKRHGMIVNDPAVLECMEHLLNGGTAEFIPVQQMKDGTLKGDLCTPEQLEKLNAFTEMQMADIVDGIASGEIAANPISHGPEQNACTYCPMKSACHKDACGTKFRYLAKVSKEAFWAAVDSRLTGEDQQEREKS